MPGIYAAGIPLNNMQQPEDNRAAAAADFPETADIDTSSDDYATRFAGPAGQWMLERQLKIAEALLREAGAGAILDVGGGHGQLAVPLCAAGHSVTVLGSSEACRGRIAAAIETGRCSFVVGNVVSLPFPDRSFDTVISFRLLTHCSRWPLLVKELCRVADRNVIVDYPTYLSVNAFAPMLFDIKKRVERNTRTWALFSHRQVRREFAGNGFRQARRRSQFFLPMVLHRMLKSPAISEAMERVCAAPGLTHLAGSPVIALMRRERQ